MAGLIRPRVVIAGTNSGVGKTTIVTGLLAYFHSKGLKAQPFKVGPDYIDPGFHEKAAGRPSYNLDTWMTPADHLVSNFSYLSRDADISIIEGVMGLYDGGAEESVLRRILPKAQSAGYPCAGLQVRGLQYRCHGSGISGI